MLSQERRRSAPWSMRRALFLLLLPAALALSNCRAALDIDELSFVGPDAGSGTTMAGGEDCLDGIDNDGDGQADCDDSDCVNAEFECIDSAGAIAVIGTLSSDKCDAPFEATNLESCENACTCTPEPSVCAIQLTLYSAMDCAGSIANISYSGDFCNDTPSGTMAASYTIPVGQAGQCSGGNMGAAPVGVQGCRIPLTGHCNGGGACIPKTQTPECLLFKGSVSCPDAYSQQKGVLLPESEGACMCSCNVTDNGCTPPTISLYSENGMCSGSATAANNPPDTCQSSALSVLSVGGVLGQRILSCDNTGIWFGDPQAEASQTLCCRKD